jgi:hypothetical protein
MDRVCVLRGCKPSADALWRAIELDDVLAAAAARLLLFTDPKRLPAVGDEAGAWALYMRVWRPGKPHRQTWPALYRQAMRYVQDNPKGGTFTTPTNPATAGFFMSKRST